MRWVLRRRYVIAGVAGVVVLCVVILGLLTPKEWETTTVVVVEPLQVGGLRSADPEALSSPEAIDAERAVAMEDPFRSAVLDTFDFPVDYRVVADASDATLRFIVRSDSADRAWSAGYSIANGYLAWGRAMEATSALAQMQGQLDAQARGEPLPAGASVDSIQQEMSLRQGALDQLAAGSGAVVVPPILPDDPVAPPLMAWLVGALVLGLAAGLVVAALVERRLAPIGEDAAPRWPAITGRRRWARVVLGLAAIAMPAVVIASLLAGVQQVWELRPTTAAMEEQNYACLERWVATVPDGRTLAVETDVAFFRDQFQEFAFPRLQVADEEHPADAVLRIAPGPGPQRCGDYHLEPRP